MIYNLFKYIYNILNNIIGKTKSLKTFSGLKNISYYYINNNKDKDFKQWVVDIKPDIIIVHSMSFLLKRDVFTIPRYGTINLHSSLLPKYRGPNPDFWTYYNLDKEAGVTLHYIDDGEDTGDIIYQESYNMPLGIKSPQMKDKAIKDIGVKLILKALNNIDNLPRITQPFKSSSPRARNIQKEEYKKIIDWYQWPIERVWHVLRGTKLWLDAISQPKGIYKGQRWEINEFEKCNTSKYKISKIYKESKKYFIACKDGKIYIKINFKLKNFIIQIIK